MKQDAWFQKNTDTMNLEKFLADNSDVSQPTSKKKGNQSSKDDFNAFTSEEKELDKTVKGVNLFKMLFS
jgi:hypothetical protein